MEKVFVYGTLKSGYGNNTLLTSQDARLVGPAFVSGRMYNLGAFPGARFNMHDDNSDLRGEVWEIDEKGLAALDVLEGVKHGLYSRKRVDATVYGETDSVWAYEISQRLLDNAGLNKRIKAGTW